MSKSHRYSYPVYLLIMHFIYLFSLKEMLIKHHIYEKGNYHCRITGKFQVGRDLRKSLFQTPFRAVWPHFWSQTRTVGALSSLILKISKVGACTVAVGTLIAFITNKFLIFSQDLSSSNFCLLVLIVPPKLWSAWIPPVGSVPHMYLGTLLLDWI